MEGKVDYRKALEQKFRQSLYLSTILAVSMFVGILVGRSHKAYAIPAYARQLGVDCEQCHTIWPRLNAFGRKFKVKGYVDQSANPGFPLAVRFMTTAQSQSTTPPGGPTTNAGVINFPSQVNFFLGTRVTPQVGVFSAITLSPHNNVAGGHTWKFSVDEQKYAWNFLPGKAVSLVAFHSTAFGFDPFPSLGNLAFEGDYSLSPGIANNGELFSPFDTSGFGLAVHGFLDKQNRYYGGVAVQTGGAVPDSLGLGIGTNDTSHEGLDYTARVAYTENVGGSGGTWNVGAAYYNGTQLPKILLPNGQFYSYRGSTNRFFLDGAVQLPIGENDLLEVIGLYGTGEDHNYFTPDPVAGVDGPFNTRISGGFGQASYYWNKQLGIRATYDTSKAGGITTTQWQYGPVYIPVHDFKVNVNAGPKSDSLGNKTFTYQLILTKMF